jgi:hypothetical protein
MGTRHLCGTTEAAYRRTELENYANESREILWKIKEN